MRFAAITHSDFPNLNQEIRSAEARRAAGNQQEKRVITIWAPSALYQSIGFLSQEKGINPAIVVGAVEEAIALATRKYYKTQENMRGELNKETGEITAYIYKTVVADDEQVEDPVNQITLEEANEMAPPVSKSAARFASIAIPARSAASQRNWPSRLSFRKSAKPSATRSSRSTHTAKRKC